MGSTMTEPTCRPLARPGTQAKPLGDRNGREQRPRPLLPLAALIVLLIILGVLMLQVDDLSRLTRLGYAGAFLTSLISSASIFLPIPGLPIIFALGGTLPSPWLVGLIAGLGDTIGELTGYLAGYTGRVIVEDRVHYRRLVARMRRYGPMVIFVLAAIPNPTFDLAGIAAGVLRIPLGRFLVACWLGKTLKTTLIALAGAGLLPWLTDWLVGVMN